MRREEMRVLDAAPNVICRLDDRLCFTIVSAAAEQLWQKTTAELLGESLLTLVSEESVPEIKSAFASVAAALSQSAQFETTINCGGSRNRIFAWSVTWSPAENGFFCAVRDVSAQKALSLIKQRFLAMVSHDIRAPLTSISVGVEILLAGKRGAMSPQIIADLIQARQSIFQIGKLVEDLLELGTLEAGKQTLFLSAKHAFNLCTAAKEAVRPTAQSSGVSLIGPKTDALLEVDENLMVKAIANLMTELLAVAVIEDTVELSVVSLGHVVEIRIARNGLAIQSNEPRQLIEKRFGEEFEQTAEGATLGLTIANTIIAMHKGTLKVLSELSGPRIFIIALAAQATQADDIEEPLSADSSADPALSEEPDGEAQ
jgi:signal transduction histidine kinase